MSHKKFVNFVNSVRRAKNWELHYNGACVQTMRKPFMRKSLLLPLLFVLFPLAALAQTATPPPALSIVPGQPDSGTLISGAQATYTFSARAGQVVTITLDSQDFDEALTLRDASGRELVHTDASGGRMYAQLEHFVIPADGTYTIVAAGNSSLASGPFTLTLDMAEATAEPTVPVAPTEQGIATVNPGQTINGTIPNGTAYVAFAFNARAGQVVTITLASDDFDAALKLRDASGRELASDDDSAGNLNARIADFVVPADGVYTIILTSTSGTSAGRYTLTLEGAAAQPTALPLTGSPPPTSAPVQPTELPVEATAQNVFNDITPITPGQTVNGTLTDAALSAAYSFVGHAGEKVTITLTSDDFDALLALRTTEGANVISDDDSAGNLNARIDSFRLQADDTYIILVSSSGGRSTGAYSLTFQSDRPAEATPQPTTSPEATATPTVLPAGSNTLNPGDTVTGMLQSGAPDSYTFSGRAGQVVSISAASEQFDAYLALKDASGNTLASDDDSAGNLNPLIQNFALPADGTYTIQIGSYDNLGVGDYSLSLAGTQTPEATPDTGIFLPFSPVGYGYTVRLAFDQEVRIQILSFQGHAGDMINVSVDSGGTFDTRLTVKRADGFVVATDDDSGKSLDPELYHLFLPTDGTYVLVITPNHAGENGTASLSLEQAALPSLDGGPQTVHVSPKQQQEFLSFTGTAGQSVHVFATAVDTDGSVPVLAAFQNGRELGVDVAMTDAGAELEFTIPANGTVTVAVGDLYGGDATYYVELQH
jgi:hypothetical protein